MINNSINHLDSVSKAVFQTFKDQQNQNSPLFGDNVLNKIQGVYLSLLQSASNFKDAVQHVFPEPEFTPTLPQENDRMPMLLTVHGGSRILPEFILSGMLGSARVQMLLFNLPNQESTFVDLVRENHRQLQKAIAGEKVKAYHVVGIAGISLSAGVRASTPWGILQAAPKIQSGPDPIMLETSPQTECMLIEEKMLTVRFDFAAQPEHEFDREAEYRDPNADFLFILSCVLSSDHTEGSGGPVETWLVPVLPFHYGSVSSHLGRTSRASGSIDFDKLVDDLEHWSGLVSARHSNELEIAATRLVSSIVHRESYVDSLIDAVMVWEALFGTSTEVTFRVTAALAKFLEPDASKRHGYRKKLKDVYGLRSRIVHGSNVGTVEAREAARLAVDVAAKALKELYRRGEKWISMKSTERADTLLLGE